MLMKNSLLMEFFTLKKILLCVAGLLVALCVILAGLDHGLFAKAARLARLKSGSPYAAIILNSSGIQKDKYPLRHSLSYGSIAEVKFMDPQELKDDTETAVIVLGDRPLDDTTPTVDMVYRVLKGVELANKFPKAVVFMSGGATKGPTPEAKMMGLIAWSRGVDPSMIILEDKSQTTAQNAQNIASIVGSKVIQQVFVIAEQSRVEEVGKIFQQYDKEFKDIQVVACDVTRDLIIEQMVRYLKRHDDRVVRGRLHYVLRGIKSKAFNFVVIPAE
jgi:uncharacterized SAM-binding protein YcdF (DUF218 family)